MFRRNTISKIPFVTSDFSLSDNTSVLLLPPAWYNPKKFIPQAEDSSVILEGTSLTAAQPEL